MKVYKHGNTFCTSLTLSGLDQTSIILLLVTPNYFNLANSRPLYSSRGYIRLGNG